MIKLKLSQGYVALIDDQDAYLAEGCKWSVFIKESGCIYAVRKTLCFDGRRRITYLHRMIMGCRHGDKKIVDHIDGDTLDCRRQNLRLVDATFNSFNVRKRAGCSSKYKGVKFDKDHGKWCAAIRHYHKRTFLGYYKDEEEARDAYREAALAIYGEHRE